MQAVNQPGSDQPDASVPLPERIRPTHLDEVVGQDALVGPEGVLRALATSGGLPSCVLWGPPGCGKTTLARLLADQGGLRFQPFSAVLGGVPALRGLLKEAAACRDLGQGTLLLVDEIHRFSKAQQDALLPHVEAGSVVLVGSTTENPSFSVNAALLSRCRVFPLQALDDAAAAELLQRVRSHPDGIPDMTITDDAWQALCRLAAGDGRRLCLLLEASWQLCRPAPIDTASIAKVVQQALPSHDRAGEAHYDVASAMIKSMRASDVQAALFYLARQLEAGEDPLFIARRLVIFACEDVGLADPQALVVAQAALAATQAIGMPEAIYPLSEATIYNATAPKSNTTKSYFAAARAVKEHPGAAVPMFLRNAPSALMKEHGYGQGYRYDHDAPDHFAGQACLPEELSGQTFYRPGSFGFEKDIAKRLAWWGQRRQSNPRSETEE